MTKFLFPAFLGILAAVAPELVAAQFYNGPGIIGGLEHAENIGGVNGRGIREIILDILLYVLFFMGLAAVVVIVIAGLYLIFSLGDEAAKDKAKKIILYAIVGLLVIGLASALVIFIIEATGSQSLFGPVPILGDGEGATSGDIRTAILNILLGVLNFMALIAVIMIVIAGIWLVVSFGDEQVKDRVKRIILYTVIGLILILLASAIVRFVISTVSNVSTGTGPGPGPIPILPTS